MRRAGSWTVGLLALLLAVSFALPGAAASPRSALSTGCPLSGFTLPSGGSFNGSGGALAAQNLDPAAVPNRGFTMNVTMFDLPAIPTTTAFFALGSEEVIGNDLLLMGLVAVSNLTGPYPLPFWGLVDNATGAVVNCGLDSYSASPGTLMAFAAEQVSQDNWTVTLNGAPFAGSSLLDLGAPQATWTGGLSVVSLAGYTGSPWLPEKASLPAALTVRTLTQPRHLPSPVSAFWEGHNATGWGEAGEAQNSSLPLGALEVGSALPFVPNGTVLWRGTPSVPVSVSLAVSPGSTPGGGRVNVSARVTENGAPRSGLNLSFTSSGGGSFSAGSPTDADGYSNVTFLSPPVSANTTLTLNASVTSNGYAGGASASLLVLPSAPIALHVEIQVTPSTSGAPGTLVTLLVTVVEPLTSGELPVPGLVLALSASRAGGAFSPSSPWTTNATGQAVGTYALPVATGAVNIAVTVVSYGYQGSGQVTISVVNPSSPSGTGIPGWGWGVIALVLAVAVVAGVLWTRRRGSKVEPQKGSRTGDEGSCPACGKPLPEPRPPFCPACGVPLGSSRAGPGPKAPV
jgi:hypothetical protein